MKAGYGVLNSPKNELWENRLYWKLSQRSFFGGIEDTVICFRDYLTFGDGSHLKFKTFAKSGFFHNVWIIKIRMTHNLSLWLYEYSWVISLFGHLNSILHFKVLGIRNLQCEMRICQKKVMIKSVSQFMHGSNFYESDVIINMSLHSFKHFYSQILQN